MKKFYLQLVLQAARRLANPQPLTPQPQLQFAASVTVLGIISAINIYLMNMRQNLLGQGYDENQLKRLNRNSKIAIVFATSSALSAALSLLEAEGIAILAVAAFTFFAIGLAGIIILTTFIIMRQGPG